MGDRYAGPIRPVRCREAHPAAAGAREPRPGLAGSGVDDVLVEVSEAGLRTRENVVVRDDLGEIRAWGSVHDRANGRMLFLHIVERELPEAVGRACSDVLVDWAVGQAREVGAARGLEVQQIDTGAFADDERQHRWLAAGGFERVRTWWQMTRPVTPEEAELVPVTGVLGVRAGDVPGGPAGRRRDARRDRPARAARGARGRVRRPLQLPRGDLRRVPVPAARGPGSSLGPLVAGRDPR